MDNENFEIHQLKMMSGKFDKVNSENYKDLDTNLDQRGTVLKLIKEDPEMFNRIKKRIESKIADPFEKAITLDILDFLKKDACGELPPLPPKITFVQSDIPSDMREIYECDYYICDCHKYSCLHCKHCSDVWFDYSNGPYMFQCNNESLTKDERTNFPTDKGVFGKCDHFEHDEEDEDGE